MKELNSTAAINGHPIHPMLVPLPITLFIAALVTDVVYVLGGSAGWADASRWLLAAGIAGALLAAIAGFIDFAGSSGIREFRDAWLHLFANLAVVAIEIANLLLRLQDLKAAASPGLYLSILATLLLLFSGWKGGELVYRHGVAQMKNRSI
jgi:uncharacterized membrane protein